MRDGLKLARAAIARRACLFNFLPSQQKVKSADSAIFATQATCRVVARRAKPEAGGESMSKQ